MNKTRQETQQVINTTILVGFIISLIPFSYVLIFWWMIPLCITSAVIAKNNKNNTFRYALTNAFMSILVIIPFLGFLASITGIIMATLSIKQANKPLLSKEK